jgi:hypothetical protein
LTQVKELLKIKEDLIRVLQEEAKSKEEKPKI